MNNTDAITEISKKVYKVLLSVENIDQIDMAVRYTYRAAAYLEKHSTLSQEWIMHFFRHAIDQMAERLSKPKQLDLWSWYERTQEKAQEKMSVCETEHASAGGGNNN